jgi:hypothetical protein
MSDWEYAHRSNCPTFCPCLCHDGYGGAHHGQRCVEAQEDWHFAYLGMEYRHVGRREDCDPCLNWKLPSAPSEVLP